MSLLQQPRALLNSSFQLLKEDHQDLGVNQYCCTCLRGSMSWPAVGVADMPCCHGRYWEVDPEVAQEASQHHKPYRIEVIGVTCDAGLAVARGVWRKLRTGRSVRSATLLRSHRLFSEHYEHTAHLADVATLYHTGQRHASCRLLLMCT